MPLGDALIIRGEEICNVRFARIGGPMSVQSSLFTLAFARKATRVSLFAMGIAIAAMPSVARADLVLIGATPAESFRDLGAQGFGAAPRLLTLQTTGVETGSVTPVDVEHGDAIDGANKSTTPTLGTLGWTSGAQVGIGFNADQSNTGITMQSLTLTIFNGTTALGSFSLASPITFSAVDLALEPGNGSSVFDFQLTAAQQAQFNTILAMAGSSGFFAGLASQLGCPAGASAGCLVSNDGPDTFIGFAQSSVQVVPLPGALPLFATALVGLGLLNWRRKKKAQV